MVNIQLHYTEHADKYDAQPFLAGWVNRTNKLELTESTNLKWNTTVDAN